MPTSSAPRPPLVLGCDTIVALAATTRAGTTLVGKNSDRPPGEAQSLALVERARHPVGATVRCQYVEIPQARETARVLASRPTWLWGYEMGLNEHGVAIGNETVFAHEAPAATGLTGMDLVRLGLERGTTAEAALEVLTDLIEAHGQGGSGYRDLDWPYNNSFLVADPNGAWILEAAGRLWAARRSRPIDAISNHIAIGADWDRLSPTAISRARESGRDAAEPFDFALAFRDADVVPRAFSEGRLRRSHALLAEGRGEHTLQTVARVLRDHDATGPRFVPGATPDQEQFYTLCMHQGPSRTAASLLASLDVGPDGPRIAWLALGRPCASVYFPLFLAGELPRELMEAGAEAGDGGGEGLWWVFERLAAIAERSPVAADAIRASFDELEAGYRDELAGATRRLAELDGTERDALASRLMATTAGRVATTARALARSWGDTAPS